MERLGDYLWELIEDYIDEEDHSGLAASILELLQDICPKAVEASQDLKEAAGELD